MSMIVQMFPAAMLVAAPIIVASLGGLFSERSGVVNIALEGIMMVGAFTAATACVLLQDVPGIGPYSAWIGCGLAIITGTVYSTLLAVSAINLKADQTIAGTAVNMLSTGLCVYLCQIIFGQQRTVAFRTGISKVKEVPFLADIPILGDALFKDIYPTIYIAFFLVVIVHIVINHTAFGLRLKACGENPHAAASVGINVYKIRWIGVLLSGAFAGLAGALLVLTSSIQFTASSIHGVGFIAVAALIFGKWKAWGVLAAGGFFGFFNAVGTYSSLIPLLNKIPAEFFSCVPYVFTVLALILFSGKTVAPKAEGQIYDQGKR